MVATSGSWGSWRRNACPCARRRHPRPAGFRRTGHRESDRPDPLRLVNPTTLQPVTGAPTLPSADAIIAPGRGRVAALLADGDGVNIYALDRAQPLFTVAFDRVPGAAATLESAPVLAWPSRHRLLVFQCASPAIAFGPGGAQRVCNETT